jgi:UDP-N-acetylmuramate--alanine ligase
LIAPSKIALRTVDRFCADVPKAHLIGVAGAGMQALAEVLLSRGWQLSGSDANAESAAWLSDQGVALSTNQLLINGAPEVIYSDAVATDHVERRLATRLGLCQSSYPQIVGRLMAGARGLAVAGTHGKSTTTAMLASIMTQADLDPTVFCGATPLGKTSGGRAGAGEWLLAEACEYRENFRFLRPEVAVLLNVEPDHFDYYRSTRELEAAFRRFAERIPEDGTIIANVACPATRRVIAAAECRVVTFGLTSPADWQAAKIRHIHGRYSFTLQQHGQERGTVMLQVPGRHQIGNALAAAATAESLGVALPKIVAGLENFRGLRRRLEYLGHAGGVELWDDYAHHPTEVRATLTALRTMYPERRVWCVFQPHQVSRTQSLVDEFAGSLQNADRVAIAEVFVARETPDVDPLELAEQLASRVRARGAAVLPDCRPQAILNDIVAAARPGDVVITMGAGDIRKRFDELAHRFRADRTSR